MGWLNKWFMDMNAVSQTNNTERIARAQEEMLRLERKALDEQRDYIRLKRQESESESYENEYTYNADSQVKQLVYDIPSLKDDVDEVIALLENMKESKAKNNSEIFSDIVSALCKMERIRRMID